MLKKQQKKFCWGFIRIARVNRCFREFFNEPGHSISYKIALAPIEDLDQTAQSVQSSQGSEVQ